jgi:hypothetical protein
LINIPAVGKQNIKTSGRQALRRNHVTDPNIIRTKAAIGEDVGEYRNGVVLKALFTSVLEQSDVVFIVICCRDSVG